MGQGSTAFLLGVVALQQAAHLPPLAWAWAGLAILPALAVARPVVRWTAWSCAGFLWALVHAHLLLGTALPSEAEGRDALVEGIVAAPPERQDRGLRFELEVERLRLADEAIPAPRRIRLSWYEGAPPIVAGERWSLRVRLRHPHGFSNPGGFDYEAWLFRKGIRATGYVRTDPDNRRLDDRAGFPLQRARQRLGERIAAALPGSESRGILTALAIGDRQDITPLQWETLRRTGTSHLVAISGLHVGMVSGLVFLLVRWGWPRAGPAGRRWAGQHAAAVAALAAALTYAALAGFSVPTQRALIMVATVMLALLLRRRPGSGHALMTALLLVLLYDPLAVMDGGFWLSFCAVATILFGMNGRIGAAGWWWRWGRLHMLVSVGLAPVLLVLFQQLPLASPLANFIAVPWVSLAVVPLVLLGTLLLAVPGPGEGPLLQYPGALLLGLADRLLGWLWPVLDLFSSLEALQWSQHAPTAAAVAAAVFGTVLLTTPRGLPGRWMGIAWLLPALLIAPPRPAAGEVWFTMLDVGQGLAAVVRTRDSVLVYDTGARFSQDFDAGGAVVLPYLRAQGIRRIDTLVISHGDNDHIGGAAAIAAGMPVGRVLAGEAEKVRWWPAENCMAGMGWISAGVRFEVAHPAPGGPWQGNDASCVLIVETGGERLLLTGDIEARAEAALLRTGYDLSARLLVAPHHGSRTSSTAAFVRAVSPEVVLFPVGYRNRWGFPHPDVVQRYDAIGAARYGSDAHGAIEVRFSPAAGMGAPAFHRLTQRRYWHHDGG